MQQVGPFNQRQTRELEQTGMATGVLRRKKRGNERKRGRFHVDLPPLLRAHWFSGRAGLAGHTIGSAEALAAKLRIGD